MNNLEDTQEKGLTSLLLSDSWRINTDWDLWDVLRLRLLSFRFLIQLGQHSEGYEQTLSL